MKTMIPAPAPELVAAAGRAAILPVTALVRADTLAGVSYGVMGDLAHQDERARATAAMATFGNVTAIDTKQTRKDTVKDGASGPCRGRPPV